MIVGELPPQRLEPDFLQQHVAVRISENFFVNAIAAADFRVRQFKGRDTWLDGTVLERAVALFFGEERSAVGDYESEIAGAGLIHAGKVHFIENPVTQREPHFAVLVAAPCPHRFWRSRSSGVECPADRERSKMSHS